MKRACWAFLPVVLSIPCAAAWSGCGSESTSADQPPIPSEDAALDGPGADASPDTLTEAQAEASFDASPDQSIDAPIDQAVDADDPWPTCDAQPSGVPEKTIFQVWQDNATTPTAVWVTNVIVTGISKGGCAPGSACQIYLQTDETYGSLGEGAQKAIKLFVSGNTSQYFTSIKRDDRVNVYAHAWRYDQNPPQNELLLQVNLQLRGCAKMVGTASPSPIPNVDLSALTLDAAENTVGPLLVQVQDLTGKPGTPTKTFALWKTGGPFVDAGPETIVSASPYFLPGASFSGLPTDGQTAVNFDFVTGIFGLFVPSTDGGTPAKYLELYPRQMAELPHP